MRLKRLEILGFKSFADPLIMDLEPGISSVVGPNGCGKSNIADALRWVLGTQSAKQIRADVMEDVIFNGSAGRKPLGMAEVKVTFDNTDRSLSLDFDEVTVTRRLFRSGVSEYMINGNRCRLMDVTDLIVDRGLGSAGYWILESEMVKTILSPRAEDRRELFDEAAGIGRYKMQRHRAGLKLSSAGSDLERLTDIISEVERSHSALRKQVASYRRYEKARKTIGQLRSALDSGELLLLEGKLSEARGELASAEAEEASQAASLASLETALAESRLRLGEAQTQLDEAHARCARVESEISSLERERAVTLERVAGMRRTAGENQARSARERERALRYRNDSGQAEAEAARWRETAKGAGEAARLAEKAAAECTAAIGAARELLESSRREEKACAEALATMRNSYLARLRAFEEARQRAAEISRRLAGNISGSDELRASLEALAGESERVTALRLQAEEELAAAVQSLAEARRSESEAALRAREAEALRGAAASQVESLRKRLEAARSQDSLGASIEPAPGMGQAVGACLDGFQSAVPVETVDGGLPSSGARYATGGRTAPGPLPGGAERMDGFLEKGGPVARSVLSHYVLAPDLDTALEWFRSQTPAGIVTRDGHLLRPDGTVRLGTPEAGAGALELASALEEAGERLAALTVQVGEMADRAARHRKSVEEGEELAEGLRKGLSELQRSEAVLASRRMGMEKELASLAAASAELSRELEGMAGLGEEAPDPDGGIREAEARLEELAGRSGAAAEELDRVRERSAGVFLEREKAAMDLREAGNRIDQMEARAGELRAEAESASSAAEELSEKAAELLAEAGSLEAGLAGQAERLKELEQERDSAGEHRNKAAAARAGLLQQTSALEEQSSSARNLHTAAREKRAHMLSESERLGERAEALRARIPDTDQDNPFLDQPPQALRDEEERQQRVIEGIGPVNMLAVEEFAGAEERLAFLSEQRKDLEQARESLQTAITEINQEAQTRFRETFAQVREHFRRVFVELFGGGEADITALDAEDPLEGGIQIMARPRGKKLENVTSLSSGERALAAVALLFSLYLVKPSPFCILDELDAPLDDANIDSFMAILRRFSCDTQFMVMTHNKRTMESSDKLYGITMAEAGVSSLTTVNLADFK